MKVTLTTPWQRLWRLLAAEKTLLTRVFLIAGFGGLVSLSLPLGIQAIINFIQAGRISTSWILLVIFVLSGIVASGWLVIRQQWLIEFFQQRVFARASLEFSLRIPRIDFQTLEKKNAVEMVNRFFDVLAIQKGLSKLIIDFSTSLLQVFFGLVLLALYHPFFIIFDLVIVVLVLTLIRMSMKKGLETSLRESNWKYKVVGWLEEMAVNVETLRMTPKSTIGVTKTDEMTTNYVQARRDHFKVLVRHYLALLLFKFLVAAGLLILGGLLVIEREIGIGQFVAAEIVILLIITSVEKIIMNLESVYDVLTALEKVGAVTDLELEDPGRVTEFSQTASLLLVEDLDIKNGPYMTEISCERLEIKAGERVFIQYSNPLFVRTLLLAFTGRVKDYQGHILFRGRALKSIDLNAFRAQIGELWGRDELITASIIDNVKAGRLNVSTTAVEQTLQRIGLIKEIRQLPEGENTMVLPFSTMISPVIAKGILLARNVIDNPDLLLIDAEQLPSDPVRYKQMLDYLLDPQHPWAVIFLSESRPDARLFDTYYKHEDGQLLPCNPDDLGATNSVVYA